MDIVTLGVIAYLLGAILSVVYPYITAYLEEAQGFNVRLIISRVIAVVLLALTAIAVPGFAETLVETAQNFDYPALYFLFILTSTYGTGSFGRTTQKLGNAVAAKFNGE